MRTALDEVSGRHDEDLVVVGDRREAVRDRNGRASFADPLEGVADESFRTGVERRRGLVEHQDARVAKERACDREALTLTARQAPTTFADEGVVATRQCLHEVMELGGACRALSISAWLAPGLPMAMFSPSVVSKRNVSWNTTPS